MFVDLDWPLNASSSPLSASAELLVLAVPVTSRLHAKWVLDSWLACKIFNGSFSVKSENIAIHIFRSNLNVLGENLAKQFTPATLYYQPQYLLMRKQLIQCSKSATVCNIKIRTNLDYEQQPDHHNERRSIRCKLSNTVRVTASIKAVNKTKFMAAKSENFQKLFG